MCKKSIQQNHTFLTRINYSILYILLHRNMMEKFLSYKEKKMVDNLKRKKNRFFYPEIKISYLSADILVELSFVITTFLFMKIFVIFFIFHLSNSRLSSICKI